MRSRRSPSRSGARARTRGLPTSAIRLPEPGYERARRPLTFGRSLSPGGHSSLLLVSPSARQEEDALADLPESHLCSHDEAVFPSYIEEAAPAARPATRGRRVLRWALAAWAVGVYVVYWLGYLGLR